MTRNKTILIIILLIIVFIIILLFSTGKNKEITKNIETIKISEELPMKIKKPVFDNQGISILKYNWELANLSLPTSVAIYKISDRQIDDNLISKFKNYFGITSSSIQDDGNAIAFMDKPKGKTFYINKKDRTATYYIDLITQNISPNKNVVSDENLIKKLKNIIGSVFDWPNNLKLETGKIERQQVLGMMYRPSDDPKSRIVYIEMFYKLNDLPVFTKKGLPIFARFFDDGNLLKFSFNLPFFGPQKIGQLPIKNIEMVKKQPNYEFKILSIKDGGGTDLLSENSGIVVQELTLNKGYLVYVYEIGNNILQPYVAFEGVGTVGNKKVVLVVGIPALENDEYN